MPDIPELAGPRSLMLKDIADFKKQITALNPLQDQLASCRAAKLRAEQRLQQAELALQTAVQARDKAKAMAEQKALEVSDLERQVNVPQQADLASANCLQSLHQNFQRVLSEMVHSGSVAPQAVAEAQNQMECLFRNLSNVSVSCQMQQPQMIPVFVPANAQACFQHTQPAQMSVALQ